jgi:hypothetical protein
LSRVSFGVSPIGIGLTPKEVGIKQGGGTGKGAGVANGLGLKPSRYFTIKPLKAIFM